MSGFATICTIVCIARLTSVSDMMERTQQIESASNVLRGCTPIVVASITYIGALTGISVWEDERRKIREEKARETYQRVITVLMKQFTGEFDIQQVAETRASLAIWGDSEVIKAASRWNRTIAEIRDDVKKAESSDGVHAKRSDNEDDKLHFNDIQRRKIEAKVAALVMTIRSSIFEESTIDTKEKESTIDTKEIEAALFDRLPGDDMRP